MHFENGELKVNLESANKFWKAFKGSDIFTHSGGADKALQVMILLQLTELTDMVGRVGDFLEKINTQLTDKLN